MARIRLSTEWVSIFGTVWNKETYSVDVFLAALSNKSDLPQNGRLKDGAINHLNYRSFPAWLCLAYFQRYALRLRD